MKIYKVGGSVRDKLLKIPSTDNDYVVVGATHAKMIKLGFKPVGKDFPVYLHPKTKEEYALARFDKKIASGHTGFSFITSKNISLEDDLKRRDITINAIAEDINGTLIDPFGGISDLKNKIIRHVSTSFIEDPLRILRVARFAARFNFTVAPETLLLMKKMVDNNELANISKERIWLECNKTLSNNNPIFFFEILYKINALKYITPELNLIFTNTLLTKKLAKILKTATINNFTVSEKFSIIYYYMFAINSNINIKQIIIDTGLDKKSKSLAFLVCSSYSQIYKLTSLNHIQIYNLIKHIDPIRKVERFNSLINIINTLEASDNIKFNTELLQYIIKKFSEINYKKLTDTHQDQIVEQIKNIKMQIIDNALKKFKLHLLP